MKLREEIDKVDEEIVNFLCKRDRIIRSVAEEKKSKGLPVYDETREAEIFERLSGLAIEKGLDPEFVRQLYKIVLQESKKVQNENISKS
ncbi:chorismate mutase [Candidatus Woesearchaeota archaeon]|nr:chorismate mutase [Candidatus Woesearchaeota archaeon]